MRKMLTLVRRAADLATTVELQEATIATLRKQLDQTQADLDWLAHEVKRIRGRVTGAIRREKDEPTEVIDLNDRIKRGIPLEAEA